MSHSYLGIDYGRSWVGLAWGNDSIATPLETVPVDKAEAAIERLINEHQVDTIVMGLSEGMMNTPTREFAKSLEHLVVEIVFVDETLSSQDAKQRIAHKKAGVRKGPDHHFAAAVLLQDYLDTLV